KPVVDRLPKSSGSRPTIALLRTKQHHSSFEKRYSRRRFERRLFQLNRWHKPASQERLWNRNWTTRIRKSLQWCRPDLSLKHTEERLRPPRYADHTHSR